MSLEPIDEDITDDLTVDGNDLLAELRAAHDRQASVDPDELTIDGAELLSEMKAGRVGEATPRVALVPEPPQRPGAMKVASDPRPQPTASSNGASQPSEATLARWTPPLSLPESDATVESRVGKASRVQILVIAAVVVVALALGGWAVRDVVREAPADAGDTSENTDENDSRNQLNDGPDMGGFGG